MPSEGQPGLGAKKFIRGRKIRSRRPAPARVTQDELPVFARRTAELVIERLQVLQNGRVSSAAIRYLQNLLDDRKLRIS